MQGTVPSMHARMGYPELMGITSHFDPITLVDFVRLPFRTWPRGCTPRTDTSSKNSTNVDEHSTDGHTLNTLSHLRFPVISSQAPGRP